MTDAHLRQLERDAAQGDLEAQARLLLERVRVGELTQERLRLAAYCGHQGALRALGPNAPDRPTGYGEWTYVDRADISRLLQLRACLAVVEAASVHAAQIAAETEESLGIPAPDHSPRLRLLSDSRDWIDQFALGSIGAVPSRRRLRKADPADWAARQLQRAIDSITETPKGNAPEVEMAEAVRLASEALGEEGTMSVMGSWALSSTPAP